MTVFLFPDSEKITADYLRGAVQATSGFSDVPVVVNYPTDLPPRLVRVRRVGGSRDNFVTDVPRIQYTAWGTDDPDTHGIAQLVRSLLLFGMRNHTVGGVPVYSVDEFGGPVPSPDPDTDRPRYFGTVDIRLRGN